MKGGKGVPIFVLAISACVAVGAQENGRTVADQVYSDPQAARGAGAYEASCAGCHRADLGGNTGPALRDQRFAREFAGKDLKALYAKVATTMPRNAPASLADNVYLDIVAYMLKENGFPAGARELTSDALDGIRVLPGRPKPPPPIGDFSYVEVVGCLSAGSPNVWTLTKATDPASPQSSSDAATASKPLGSNTFHLVDAMAYSPDAHKGQKMYVRGLLIKLADEQRITISAFEMVSPTCRE
jgi:S-disulfanyl-L-cysteine oxidoreductase SoxD